MGSGRDMLAIIVMWMIEFEFVLWSCHLPALWYWESSQPLSLYFLSCKVGINLIRVT